jgi:hypothetical protein
MRNVSDKSCRENNIHFVFNIFLNRVLYGIMWKNMVEPDRPQVATQYGAKKCDFNPG